MKKNFIFPKINHSNFNVTESTIKGNQSYSFDVTDESKPLSFHQIKNITSIEEDNNNDTNAIIESQIRNSLRARKVQEQKVKIKKFIEKTDYNYLDYTKKPKNKVIYKSNKRSKDKSKDNSHDFGDSYYDYYFKTFSNEISKDVSKGNSKDKVNKKEENINNNENNIKTEKMKNNENNKEEIENLNINLINIDNNDDNWNKEEIYFDNDINYVEISDTMKNKKRNSDEYKEEDIVSKIAITEFSADKNDLFDTYSIKENSNLNIINEDNINK
jgi:hypothetical protein